MLAKMIGNCLLRKKYGCNSLRPSMDSVLSKLRDFESEAGRDYFDAFTRIELKKGSFLIREGEISANLWFLEEGLARLVVRMDKDEVTGDFFFPSEFIDIYDSSTLKIPSGVTIELLSDSVLYTINWERLEMIKQCYPVLAEIEKMIVASYLHRMEKRIFELQALTSTERYVKLIKTHPYMIHQVSLTYIASYLGITIETISRIRKKIKKTPEISQRI